MAVSSLLLLSGCSGGGSISSLDSILSSSSSSSAASSESSGSSSSSGTSSSSSSSSASSSGSSSSASSESSESSSSESSIHTHVYGNTYTITVQPTLTTAGKATHKCESDDATEEVEVPALSDTAVWTKTTVKEPTHAEDGEDDYSSVYGTVKVTIAKKSDEHVYGTEYTITTEPTLTSAGKATRKCESDDATEEVEVPALSDTAVWTKTTVKEPTHTEDGEDDYSSIYGTVKITTAKKSDEHVYGNTYTITVNPTLTTAGKATRKCESDDAIQEVEVPALSDTSVWTKTTVKEATDTEEGTYKYTSIYGALEITHKHTGSNKYTALKKDDGTVDIYESCALNDGGIVGDVVNTMTAKTAAEYDIDVTSKVHPWAQDGSGSKTWTSAEIGNSSSSYMVLKITKGGWIKISYKISSETSDKLHIKNGSTEILSVGGLSTDEYKTGTIEFEAKGNDSIDIYYQKDGSVNKGKDQAIITLEDSTFNYSATNYITNGGTAVTPSFIENGKIVGDLPSPTKDGCYFEGWYIDEGLETPYDANTANLVGDASLYAKWSDALYVTLHTGDTTSEIVSFQNGTTPTLPADPTRDGYYFIGWYTDSAYSTAYESKAATASFDLYAKWVSVAEAGPLYGSYKGFFVGNSSSSTTTSNNYAEVEVDATKTLTLRTYYSGYAHGTVEVNEDGTVNVTSTESIKSVYVDDSTLIVAYTYSSSTTRYYFVSKENEACSSTGVSAISVNNGKDLFVSYSVGDTAKTAYIDQNGTVYTGVSFVDSSGEAVAVSDLKSKLTFFVKKDGNTIASFYATQSSGTYSLTNDDVAGSYTCGDGETLVLSGGGKALFSKIKSDYSSTLYEAKYEVIEDDTIYVYYSSSDRYLITLSGNSFTYEVRNVTVTLDYGYAETEGGDNKTDTYTQLYDKWSYIPSDKSSPTRDGYTFDGWYASSDCSGSKVTGGSYTEGKTLYAKWIKNYTVSYKEVDGTTDVSGCESTEVTGGKKLSSLPTPTAKDGYDFDGWYLDKECTKAFDISTPINEDTTLYAHWTTPLTITKYLNNVDGEETPTTQSAQYNRAPTIETPTKEGYVFAGWYTDKELTQPFDATAPLTTNVTLYAKYEDESEFKGSYYGYNLYYSSYYPTKTGNFTANNALNIKIDGYGTTSGKFDWKITNVDETAGKITFTKGNSVGYGWYLKAADGRIFIITGYTQPTDEIGTDMNFLVLNTNSSETLSYKQTKSGNVFTVVVSVDGVDTYTVNIDTSAKTFTFAGATA